VLVEASKAADRILPERRACGWGPRAQSDDSKSEQVRQCMDLQHCLHWLHAVAPTHLKPRHVRCIVHHSHQLPTLLVHLACDGGAVGPKVESSEARVCGVVIHD
jgi:hypothetical protein